MVFNSNTTSNRFLSVQPDPTRKRNLQPVPPPVGDDDDDFLTSDLEISFASNVSLNSPPRELMNLSSELEPMDISPAPPVRYTTIDHMRNDSKPQARLRAFTSAARTFGRDMSNGVTPSSPLAQQSQKSDSRRIQRGALPVEWLMEARPTESSNLNSNQDQLAVPSPISEDGMDVDSDVPDTAKPPTATGFDTLFYDTMSPHSSPDKSRGPFPNNRRSLSPDAVRAMVEATSSPSGPPSSPTQNQFERIPSGNAFPRPSKPSLPSLGAPSNFSKKPRKLVLSALVPTSGMAAAHSASAYPASSDQEEPREPLPTRRAFSALFPPKGFGFNEPYSEESSFDGPDMSSPAQAYAKRQQVKSTKRCDGTEDVKPLAGVVNRATNDSPSSRHLSAGIPGFGDNEAHGKILPCHRVKDDGLMRINARTLDDLLDGVFASKISAFHVIDCRFDYEYNGGHIRGAVNIKTPSAVEDFLLGSHMEQPQPCVSGDTKKKTVLIFHCEFSSKRAPTFAKHLRAKDRALNNHVYPKIHYPEVYILEGGYCQYFKHSAARCQPVGYVSMDDPNHVVSRNEDMDQFRKIKFGRYKSYTYGEGPFKPTGAPAQQQQQQPLSKRNTAPSGGANALFAAATAARTRRGNGGGNGLSSLAEDGNSTAHSDEDTDIGDSPCPPPTKTTVFKGKKLGRAPLMRAETYGPSKMAL